MLLAGGTLAALITPFRSSPPSNRSRSPARPATVPVAAAGAALAVQLIRQAAITAIHDGTERITKTTLDGIHLDHHSETTHQLKTRTPTNPQQPQAKRPLAPQNRSHTDLQHPSSPGHRYPNHPLPQRQTQIADRALRAQRPV